MSLAYHLLQTMPQAVCCCDEHGVVQGSSPAVHALLQHTPESLHGKALLELIHREDIDIVEDALVMLSRQEDVNPCGLRIVNGHAWGHAYVAVQVRFTADYDAAGLLEHVLLWLEPVETPIKTPTAVPTEQSTEKRATSSEQPVLTLQPDDDANTSLEPQPESSRATAVMDSIADSVDDAIPSTEDFYMHRGALGLCVLDAQGYFVYVNEATAQFAKMPAGDLLGQNLWQMFAHGQHNRVGAALQHAMQTREPVYFETLHEDDQFDVVWFGVHASPVADQLVLNIEDITERKYQQQQLEAAEVREEALFGQRNAILESISDYLFILDSNYRFLYANEVMLELLEETPESIRKYTVWDTAHLSEQHPFHQAYVKTLREQKPQRVRAHANHPKLVGHILDITMYPFQGGLIAYSRDITELETTRADLAQALAEKETILNSITDGVSVLDHNWTYVYANPVVLERVPDILGRNYFEVFPQHRDSTFAQHYQQAFDSQKPVFFEAKTLTSGEWADVRVYPAGERITVYATNITERKQLEHALIESEAKFRAFFENSTYPCTMFTFTAGKQGFVYNDAFADFVKDTAFADYQAELGTLEGTKRMLTALSPAEDTEREKRYFEEILAGTRNSYRMEKRYLNRYGSIIWGDLMSVSVRNDQGELVLTFATVQDITKRKRTEQALLDSEAKFRHFFAANSVAHQMVTFMGTSKQTVHIETNNTFEILFADSALAELEPLMSLVDYRALGRAANHPDNPHDFMPPRAAPNSTHTRHNEKRYFNRDGSVFWCDVSKVSFYDAQGLPEVCLSSYQDVTDRKHAQAALEKALADKEMLLKEVHHRTKNNMQLISSMLSIQSRRIGDEMAQQALVESSKRINLLASIHRALYQMPESGDIDAGEQLHYVLEGLTKGLRDTPITINSDIAHVTLDVHQAIPLMLVANELLTNAFKHAFVTPQAGDELTVRLLLEDNNVIFELIDNGVGVPVGAADKDSLGMVIIATLTNQLNADLTLENQPTGGTVARVTFTKHMPLV